jgi:SAM-dependent MidA family methyltransferase
VATLEEEIKDKIRRIGPIPFAEFMRMALYNPQNGYYIRDQIRIGVEGDFYTAPTTHPGFGALLALQIENMWNLLDEPNSLTLLEGGGHKGFLANDILIYLQQINPILFSKISYHLVEQNRTGFAQLNERKEFSIEWNQSTTIKPIDYGIFISNELFDAFPRHRVIKQNKALLEIYVTLSNENDFIELLDEPSGPELEDYFDVLDIDLPERCQAEIDLEGPDFMRRIALAIRTGFSITIDYGFDANNLYTERMRQGTLLSYFKHTASNNYYIRVGRQDLTAHINFTSLAKAGEEGGMETVGLIAQQHYLKKLGIQTFLDQLREAGLEQDLYFANRMSLLELTRLEGFGRFGVLVQSKNIPAADIDDIVISRARSGDKSLPLPLLTEQHMPLLQGRYPHLDGNQLDINRFL